MLHASRVRLEAVTIRVMEDADAQAVLAIYQQGIDGKNATFETECPSWEHFDRSHLDQGRFVAELGGSVVGWVALSPSSSRCVYQGVVESSVYVSDSARGQGVGRALMEKLIEESEALGFWTILAGIFRENVASCRLHESLGFRLIGFNERLGVHDGVWRDVLRYERRSQTVGVGSGCP